MGTTKIVLTKRQQDAIRDVIVWYVKHTDAHGKPVKELNNLVEEFTLL